MLFGNKRIQFFVCIIFFFLLSNLHALENKILIKVNNEIITSLDINNEINYLIALNKKIENFLNTFIPYNLYFSLFFSAFFPFILLFLENILKNYTYKIYE